MRLLAQELRTNRPSTPPTALWEQLCILTLKEAATRGFTRAQLTDARTPLERNKKGNISPIVPEKAQRKHLKGKSLHDIELTRQAQTKNGRLDSET